MRPWVLAVTCACAGGSTTPTTSSTTSTTPTPGCEGIEGGVITVETSDGLALEADYLPHASCGAPGIVLLHMIPPGNDRSNWPGSFRHALLDAGFAVLTLDRRGAGGSEGDPVDAYEGPDGWRDVEAAAARLRDDGYGELALLGASNGTTSMIDYAVRAAQAPVALGFMTGGPYTENQHAMGEVPEVPAVFTYSTQEAAWSTAQQAGAPSSWVFHEYPDGAHGTQMFDAAPEVADALVGFYVDNVLTR